MTSRTAPLSTPSSRTGTARRMATEPPPQMEPRRDETAMEMDQQQVRYRNLCPCLWPVRPVSTERRERNSRRSRTLSKETSRKKLTVILLLINSCVLTLLSSALSVSFHKNQSIIMPPKHRPGTIVRPSKTHHHFNFLCSITRIQTLPTILNLNIHPRSPVNNCATESENIYDQIPAEQFYDAPYEMRTNEEVYQPEPAPPTGNVITINGISVR